MSTVNQLGKEYEKIQEIHARENTLLERILKTDSISEWKALNKQLTELSLEREEVLETARKVNQIANLGAIEQVSKAITNGSDILLPAPLLVASDAAERAEKAYELGERALNGLDKAFSDPSKAADPTFDFFQNSSTQNSGIPSHKYSPQYGGSSSEGSAQNVVHSTNKQNDFSDISLPDPLWATDGATERTKGIYQDTLNKGFPPKANSASDFVQTRSIQNSGISPHSYRGSSSTISSQNVTDNTSLYSTSSKFVQRMPSQNTNPPKSSYDSVRSSSSTTQFPYEKDTSNLFPYNKNNSSNLGYGDSSKQDSLSKPKAASPRNTKNRSSSNTSNSKKNPTNASHNKNTRNKHNADKDGNFLIAWAERRQQRDTSLKNFRMHCSISPAPVYYEKK